MRFVAFLIVACATALASTAAEPRQQKDPPAKGGPGGLSPLADKLFDTLAKGADAIMIADAPAFLKADLEAFAKANNIKNGMLDRKQFEAFVQTGVGIGGAIGGAGGK
ncbi:MAG TPA: hypothetical protein VE988_13375, partial [Gemmataceae bacterium]|nr:hypothetical protein [Gemmataceae bacterium]